jgi:hypothetical protein
MLGTNALAYFASVDAECRVLNIMLSVIIQNVIILNIFMMNVFILSVVLLLTEG